MKLTILGSGTVVPDGARNSAGYFVEAPSVRMMMDCGAGTVHALARYGLPWESMTHVFISHFHADHVGELASLLFAFKWGMKSRRKESLTLLGPVGLRSLLSGLDQVFGLRLGELGFLLECRELSPPERLELARGSTLSVTRTPHTRNSLAVRIDDGSRSICYTGDTAYSEEVALFFSGTDLMVSECSFKEPNPETPHLSIQEVSAMARRAGAARLAVTHFYFDVDEPDLEARIKQAYSGQVLIGRDGMVIEI
jgi:ribonuclease BN (tRNA processing enzyme)